MPVSEVELNLEGKLLCYVAVCNEILAANETRFPYAHIWRAIEGEVADKYIEFIVAKGCEKAHVYMQFLRCRMSVINRPFESDCRVISKTLDWPYVHEVTRNPPRYIANPALIDWDWVVGTNVVQFPSKP